LINTSVTELMTRRYQVLPMRTHPDMNTSGTGGFVLQALTVRPDKRDAPEQSSGKPAASAAVPAASEGAPPADPVDAGIEDTAEPDAKRVKIE
jgi:tRNA (adenine-N(1)-)-methyltransferase non-catalytic subunit